MKHKVKKRLEKIRIERLQEFYDKRKQLNKEKLEELQKQKVFQEDIIKPVMPPIVKLTLWQKILKFIRKLFKY